MRVAVLVALVAIALVAVIWGVRYGHGTMAPVPAAATLGELFGPLASNERVPALSVAVIADGGLVFAQGFGSTSLDEPRPATPNTQYRLASVSKVFTAAGVLALVQDGKVILDDPARQYCPELSPLNAAPTVRHFLMHRSGMRHTTDTEDTTIKGGVPRFGIALKQVAGEALRFTPGTKTLYTSWGYVALGCVIETASGQPYADFMRDRVFSRVGLMSTTFDEPTYSSSTFSAGFRRSLLGGLRPSTIVDTRFKTPASGVISTANDMVRFAQALFDGRLLSHALVEEMFKVVPDGAGRAGFTAGWTAKGAVAEGLVFDYNGSMEGATAFLDVVPERHYALALLANRERYVAELQPFINEARHLVLSRNQR